MDPMGGIVMTSDGNAILREVSLQAWFNRVDNTACRSPSITQLPRA